MKMPTVWETYQGHLDCGWSYLGLDEVPRPRFDTGDVVAGLCRRKQGSITKMVTGKIKSGGLGAEFVGSWKWYYIVEDRDDGQRWNGSEDNLKLVEDTPAGWEPKESS